MPELTVIVTSESEKRLASLIEGLRCDPGYGNGRDVRKDENVPGKYILTEHNGEQDLPSQSVRVIGEMVIAGKAAPTIEGMLRAQKIPFKSYNNITILNPNAQHLNVKLPQEPNLVYNH